jgi:hypothetical protein
MSEQENARQKALGHRSSWDVVLGCIIGYAQVVNDVHAKSCRDIEAMKKKTCFIPKKWYTYFEENVMKRASFYVVDERSIVGWSGVVYHSGRRPENGRRVSVEGIEDWKGECECGEWQQRGVICVHGYRLAKFFKLDEEHNDFIEWCFPKVVYRTRLEKLYRAEMQMVIPPLEEIEPDPVFALNAPNILTVYYLRSNFLAYIRRNA